MAQRTILTRLPRAMMPGLALLAFVMGGTAAHAQALASITNMVVSPRIVGTSSTQNLDVVATGLDTVGVGKTVYLAPSPNAGAASKINGYSWSVTQQPSAGAASITYQSGALFKFRPMAAGAYTIKLTPLDKNNNPTTATTISVWAAEYLGATGGWSCATCHNGIYAEDKITPWSGTAHAGALKTFLDGNGGAHFGTTCLPCHTTGSYANTRGDGNFLDVAASLNFDLNQIPAWVTDAANTGNSHWNDLPAALQQMANVQCESCHGPGKTHNGNVTRISVPSFDGTSCNVCHDAPTHEMKPYQWRNSAHSVSNLAGGGHVQSGECTKCHTSEGFVEVQVDGNADISPDLTSRSPVSCVGCHDPHDATNPHQLRKVDAVTLPNGMTFDEGLGNLCANCHNSRIASAADAVDLVKGNSRGSHHGPQSDILIGSSAYDWDMSYPVTISPHYIAVGNGCVDCHMATAPSGSANPPAIGDHTFRINDEASTASTVVAACDSCHAGLKTTDRLPTIPRDFDGNGASQGVQTEVTGLMLRVRTQLLNRLAGSSLASDGTVSVGTADWKNLTLNQRAALYNFNLLINDGSHGVHNTAFTVAVLQRSYLHLTGNRYNVDYPSAFMVDNDTRVVTNAVPATRWQMFY